VARNYSLWFKCVASYTLTGGIGSISCGALLGAIGAVTGHPTSGPLAMSCISAISLALAARERGWVRWDLPERKRQTEKYWAHDFGFPMAFAMWGFHIGLALVTRITFGGLWILVALAIMSGKPSLGAVLMLAHWLGRALPVWVAPRLLCDTRSARGETDVVGAEAAPYRHLASLGLLAGALLAASLAISGVVEGEG